MQQIFEIFIGLVCNLKGEFITQVALGKAHAVALTTKGQVYTFGINNKYQCGRDFVPQSKEGINLFDIFIIVVTFDFTNIIQQSYYQLLLQWILVRLVKMSIYMIQYVKDLEKKLGQ